jgi:hypothetical protein
LIARSVLFFVFFFIDEPDVVAMDDDGLSLSPLSVFDTFSPFLFLPHFSCFPLFLFSTARNDGSSTVQSSNTSVSERKSEGEIDAEEAVSIVNAIVAADAEEEHKLQRGRELDDVDITNVEVGEDVEAEEAEQEEADAITAVARPIPRPRQGTVQEEEEEELQRAIDASLNQSATQNTTTSSNNANNTSATNSSLNTSTVQQQQQQLDEEEEERPSFLPSP